jgi:leucyl-tRNA synthetase
MFQPEKIIIADDHPLFRQALKLMISAHFNDVSVLEAEDAQRWLEGKSPKKVIVVPKRIINVVV